MSKLFIGPMSKNVVDTVLNYATENNVRLGLLPSRRQIEFDGGYVNNWMTHEFIGYAGKNKNIILQRDHAGPLQGKTPDDGTESLILDATLGFDYCTLIRGSNITTWTMVLKKLSNSSNYAIQLTQSVFMKLEQNKR